MASSCPKHILDIILQQLNCEYDILSIKEAKSAQQKMWILKLSLKADKSSSTLRSSCGDSKAWKECLQRGQNRLVVRQWQGGSRWWNLHSNQDPKILAKAEVFGYRSARQSLTKAHGEGEKQWIVVIPRLLYYYDAESNNDELPCAIFEYVGMHSTCFDSHRRYDDSYVTEMIKTRHEFGFDEPHPRWGRLPIEGSLEYANCILEQVVIPLHTNPQISSIEQVVQTYESMLQLYGKALKDMKKQQNILCEGSVHKDSRMAEALDLLENAVTIVLPDNIGKIPPLPASLVHLDLQPQNLLFSRDSSDKRRISSVLDWEEAAVSDPRFELLLLGRKVCANREQAELLWKSYCDSTNKNLGLLHPWLQLETIHSITTLLLQSMNLLNGGRNPWETKKDLWEKIRREFVRWERLCQEDNANEQKITKI
eukprot:CAMPEP_0194221758 /NCGR_PEP_ID=MMETSP0156-20130528/31284_1 /TAXON_ID=33649 /ORGANISM="Thalassionema nitzschioides, Strain L26-B" /LENGTH=423 /DNA_ID=CAMNT_0038952277 /DNA_START=30 /DNA_END=1301 /DNA_ORIENTATION=+